MGNSNSALQEEQLQIIQDKLHKPNPDLKFDEELINRIINLPALELQKRIISRRDVDLPQAFKVFHYKKMLENNEHRALTDVIYEKPSLRSDELQKKLNDKSVKADELPLLGFIMSIKDSNKLKGTVCTNGFAINVGLVETEQPESIKLLIEKGAIITCKGNVPQALFSMESMNNVFGCALNPHNKLRAVGGSSGGDSALVALKCVNSAIGSDVAGSLRIPALFCGVVGYKPTINRISNDQLCTYFYKQPFANTCADRSDIIRPTIGPITNTVDDAEAIMKVLVQTYKHDRLVPPLPWRTVGKPKKMGLFIEFSQIEVSPTHKRALNMAADALKKHGIEIIPMNLDDFFEDLFFTSSSAFFKNEALRNILEGNAPMKESLIPTFKNLNRLLNLPHFLVKHLANKESNDRRQFFLRGLVKSRSNNSSTIKNENTAIYDRFRKFMEEKDIQMMLAPGMVTPAVLHGTSNDNNMQAVYTFMFNLLDFPTGVLPITRVAEDEQYYETKYDDLIAKSFEENMKNSAGLPVGIQVAALPWMDEDVFEVMKVIEKEVQYK